MKDSGTVGLIGIGVFLLLALNGLHFASSKILEEAFLLAGFRAFWVYAIAAYAGLLLALLAFMLATRIIQTKKRQEITSIKKLFLFTVAAYLATQLLGFLLPFFTHLYDTAAYLSLKESYISVLDQQLWTKQMFVDLPLSILKPGLLFLIIWREI